jgi:hypothetical protein
MTTMPNYDPEPTPFASRACGIPPRPAGRLTVSVARLGFCRWAATHVMKKIIITGITATSLVLMGCGKKSSPSENSVTPPSVQPSIDFNGVDPQQVLSVYAGLSRLELVIDPSVKSIHTPIVLHNSNLSSSEMMTSIEKALTEQAGIVINRLDEKKASVTYNSSLPITKAK